MQIQTLPKMHKHDKHETKTSENLIKIQLQSLPVRGRGSEGGL